MLSQGWSEPSSLRSRWGARELGYNTRPNREDYTLILVSKGEAYGETKKISIQTVTSHLGQLTREELEELQEVVAALLEVTVFDSVVDEVALLEAREGRKPRKGVVSTKMINGYGPYLYLRFWSEGTLKSLDIGKKEDYIAE